MQHCDGEVDVLIVGGGPAGLCASLALSRAGIGSLLVERHPGTAIHPKALHLSTRTMEVLRAWDVVDDVRPLGLPIGDHALFVGRSMTDPEHVRLPIWPDDPAVSAERSTLVSQEVLEPVLRHAAERAGVGELRFSTRLTALDHTSDADVLAHLDGPDGPSVVRARWVIGADGANSLVRRLARIDFPGRDIHESVNILFGADLAPLLAGHRSAFYYVHNEQVRGLLPVVDNERTWRLHLMLGDGETVEDYQDPARQTALIRAAVGVPDLEIELRPCYGWIGGARVAQRYRHGRLFLAGDAAHVNPPSGGLGMNMGMQDVHNLVWKLVAVLRGEADEALLDTYDTERRPVALRTVAEAVRNHEFESAPAHTEEDRRRKHARRRQNGLVLGHHYEQGAFAGDGTPVPPVADPYTDFVPTARPGHRAPHLWVDWRGRRTTLLDALEGDRATLLVAGHDIGPWVAAAAALRAAVVTVGPAPARAVADLSAFTELYGLRTGGAVLVRPDGIVAVRLADPPDEQGARSVLARASAALHRGPAVADSAAVPLSV